MTSRSEQTPYSTESGHWSTTTASGPSAEALLQEVAPVIAGAVRHKLRVTLSASDHREQNLDAQDVVSEIRVKLLKKLSSFAAQSAGVTGDGAGGNSRTERVEGGIEERPQERIEERIEDRIKDFRAYAATVSYNCCNDYLRARHPERTSLKNCLRRFMEKLPAYAVWESREGDLICGLSGWRTQKQPAADPALVAKLRHDPSEITVRAVPRKHLSALNAEDWQTLLDSLLGHLGGPVPLDDLISLIAPLVGVEDIPDISESSGDEDDDGATPLETAQSREPSAYSIQLAAERLTLLWAAIRQLLVWHRAAYLLNIPDGELEAFPYYGVATRQQIGEALELKDEQFDAAWKELQIGADLREQARTARRYAKKFAILWEFLPLEDNIIARMLKVTRPQVIGYRNKAVERLKRHMKCVR